MLQILGDENEEAVRKAELRSIVSAGFWGFWLGGLVGWVVAGYGGFLFGLFIGAVLMAQFSLLGVRATRRKADRLMAEAKAKTSQGGGASLRNPGRPR